jgi:hypothetical protein
MGIPSTLLILAAGLQDPETAPAAVPTVEGFRHAPGRIAAGRVHRYRKSNLDGSQASEIALYLASETRIESLKWHPEEAEATLVIAEMDWEVASVRALQNFRVQPDGSRTLVAELETTPDRKRLVARIGEQELACELERFPWHSYDFDLASLNVALRFLTQPEGEVELAIVDPVQGPAGTMLVARGSVLLAYEASEERNGLPCRRYVLDGPGLEDRGGKLWASTGDEVFLVAFEIALPDEPGMDSGRLEWLRNETKSPSEWETFVRERRVGEER